MDKDPRCLEDRDAVMTMDFHKENSDARLRSSCSPAEVNY